MRYRIGAARRSAHRRHRAMPLRKCTGGENSRGNRAFN
ncbi:hypothetical protein BVG79_00433 [Ketogulonicigenium robustum]|uniref:Uncharacterized protein n=1 Tax=Ketogulonicigenium robustum TaxID=92947 RepID=A0A1W6NXP8_9RHOB|nr:hypothetical protein BVG79_00433 [Ketogulonicigenium robustum]